MTITLNKEKNGIELRFDGKPSDEVREAMKNNGFKWSMKQKMWYAHMNDERIAFANSLEDGAEVVSSEATKAESFNLWDMTRTDGIGTNKDEKLDNVAIAALCRKHLKARFPFVKMSVNSNGWNSVNLSIKSSPFAEDSDELKAILNYCKAYISSYNYCTCYDPYGDYGSSYNFYGSYDISYNYEQDEPTEESMQMGADFQLRKAQFEQEEEIRAEEQRKKDAIEQQLAKEEYERQEAIRKENHKKVMKKVVIRDDVDYVVENLVDYHISKEDRLSDYDREDGDEPTYYTCKVKREVHMDNETYNLFCNMLLDDWSFIAGTGGSATDDQRIGSMLDYHNMTKEEQETVEWYSTDCVAIFLNKHLMFVVDAQGYNYCRYVYAVDGHTETKMVKVSVSTVPAIILADNQRIAKLVVEKAKEIEQDNGCEIDAQENLPSVISLIESFGDKFYVGVIRALSEEYDKLKTALYRAMQKMSGCQYRFGKANLKAGQRVTLVKIGEFGGIHPQHITINRVTNQKYAQYDDAVRIDHRPEHKRTDYYTFIHGDCLVYDGWLPEIREDVLWDVVSESNNCIMKKGKFMSFDHGQYDAVMDYYKKLGFEPIVNTYNPFR